MTAPRPCPACGAARGKSVGEKSAYVMLRCASCATLHTSVMPTSESLHDLYAAYYGEANLTAPDFVEARLGEIARSFIPYRQNGKLLDVGFGAGTLMEAARRAGWQPSGTEVSEAAVESAAARGFDVAQGHLADVHYPDASFDVVTAVEVLEHLTDPLALLVEIRRILRPGGLLWATTPHGRGLSARLLRTHWSVVSPPEHIQLFSMPGMRTLLRRAGYGDVRLAAHGVNPFEIVTHLRGRDLAANDRVGTSYELNEYLSTRPSRRAAKRAANAVLSALRLGDSLKVHATK
jgi:2-polyprenyl-3-methyl-5-hydroxy-6-metoxy-1,4-benzoquinol methylase